MYEQLLKFEVFELRKKAALSWERILEIRHLKDRMIRKCHKLAKNSSPKKSGDPFSFQSIIAPSDFRVREMERWFQQQQKRTSAFPRRPPARATGQESYSRNTERVRSIRNLVNLPSSNRQLPDPPRDGKRLPAYFETRPTPELLPLAEKFALMQPALPAIVPVSTPIRSVSSPLPLPHLLRVRDLKTGYDMSADPQKFVSLYSFDSHAKDEQPDVESPSPKQEIDTPRPEIRRRRSCIKRSSMSDLIKTVSWADDHGPAEQTSRHTSVVRDVHASGQFSIRVRLVFHRVDAFQIGNGKRFGIFTCNKWLVSRYSIKRLRKAWSISALNQSTSCALMKRYSVRGPYYNPHSRS